MKRLTLGLAALALAATAAAAEPRGRDYGPRGGYAPRAYERGIPAYGRSAPGPYGGRAAPYPYDGYGPGPRPGQPYGPPSYGPAYPSRPPRGFARGQFLPQAYWGGFIPDPRAYRLRRPPNGYGWVAVGPNAYLLQRSTGLILDTAPLY